MLPLLAGIGSLAVAVLAGVWTVVPSTNGFLDGEFLARDSSLLGGVLSPVSLARTLFAMALAGVAVASMALVAQQRSIRTVNGIVAAFGLVFAVVVGFGMLSETVLSAAGYLMALLVAGAAVVVGVQVVRTSRIGRWIVAVSVGALVSVFTFGVLPVSAVSELAGEMLPALARQLPSISVVLGLTAVSLVWAVTGSRALADTGVMAGFGAWVLRNRRVITIVAALGPLPYALVRLTWLTPWPQGLGGMELPPDMRIWGLMLSAGAWAGFVLTLGLIRPWGEVFPGWMPVVAGRPVPVWVAAAPGSVVAAILCVSAVPMIRMFGSQGAGEALVSALIFPMWFWGPALALAVWGYVLHRRGVAHPAAERG